MRSVSPIALASLIAAAAAQQTPQLALNFCAASRAAEQTWYFDTANTTIVLASSGFCIDILEYGTNIGSTPYTAPCHHDDKDPSHQNQEWSTPSQSAPGSPIIETMSSLSLDVCSGYGAVPGAQMTLCSATNGGTYFLNVTSPANGGSGTLIHAQSGLCVDAGGVAPPAPPGPSSAVVLNACSDAPAVALRQVFTLDVNGGASIALLAPALGGSTLCLTAPGDANHSGGLLVTQCAPPSALGAPPPIQIFSLDANGYLQTGFSPLVADAGSELPFYRGAATMLSPPAASSRFAFNSSGLPAGAGRLVHAASGLCLDAGGVPTSHGCIDRAVRGLPFCDPTLSLAERVADLVSRLTLDEKIGLTGADLHRDGSCDTKDPGVPRLDVPPMQWLVETTSMAASACYNGTCATSFPSAQNLAASFNRSLFYAKGVVVGNEMRALNNLHWTRHDGVPDSMQSLSGFGPDINQPRDPRNGRAGELPTEDPYLMGHFGSQYVRGCQDSPSPFYVKMITGLKHYVRPPTEPFRTYPARQVHPRLIMWDPATFSSSAFAGRLLSRDGQIRVEGRLQPLRFVRHICK